MAQATQTETKIIIITKIQGPEVQVSHFFCILQNYANVHQNLETICAISKMIPTAPFTPRVITMSQCPIRILDWRLNSRISLFHWSLSQSYDAWCKGRSRLIFDISRRSRTEKTDLSCQDLLR